MIPPRAIGTKVQTSATWYFPKAAHRALSVSIVRFFLYLEYALTYKTHEYTKPITGTYSHPIFLMFCSFPSNAGNIFFLTAHYHKTLKNTRECFLTVRRAIAILNKEKIFAENINAHCRHYRSLYQRRESVAH